MSWKAYRDCDNKLSKRNDSLFSKINTYYDNDNNIENSPNYYIAYRFYSYLDFVSIGNFKSKKYLIQVAL